ncbi:MAG: hypothetical protein ABL967_05930 [Bryobacteraceae bacterium]
MTPAISATGAIPKRSSNGRFGMISAWLVAAAVVAALTIYGASYYRLDIESRPLSDLHPILRPSGTVGLRLGMLGVAMFFVIFTYPLRKRWRWLSTIGQTRQWLNFHILLGILAPALITFHSSFKWSGLAGVAYWIMVAVALSGFVGRYIYAKIPRSVHATELDLRDLAEQSQRAVSALEQQAVVPASEIAPLLAVPDASTVRRMGLATVLWSMTLQDLARPFRAASLRRHVLDSSARLQTLGGLFRSRHVDLEAVISVAGEQSSLAMKIAVLDRLQKAMHIWHVIHRPFSISFAILVVVHIVIAVSMGYF